eukprot:7631714-Ditylum_brightwellii.AAC.1
MIKRYNGCAWEVKEKIMDTHQLEFQVCQYMSRKLKGIKIPRKRVCWMKMLKSAHIEVGDSKVRWLVRERKKYPIRLVQKTSQLQYA